MNGIAAHTSNESAKSVDARAQDPHRAHLDRELEAFQRDVLDYCAAAMNLYATYRPLREARAYLRDETEKLRAIRRARLEGL